MSETKPGMNSPAMTEKDVRRIVREEIYRYENLLLSWSVNQCVKDAANRHEQYRIFLEKVIGPAITVEYTYAEPKGADG